MTVSKPSKPKRKNLTRLITILVLIGAALTPTSGSASTTPAVAESAGTTILQTGDLMKEEPISVKLGEVDVTGQIASDQLDRSQTMKIVAGGLNTPFLVKTGGSGLIYSTNWCISRLFAGTKTFPWKPQWLRSKKFGRMMAKAVGAERDGASLIGI